MKVRTILIVVSIIASLFFGVYLGAADFPEEVVKAKNSIKGRMLVSYIDFLASKYCRGRLPGDKGMPLARTYISSVLKGAGVKGAIPTNRFYQDVPLKTIELDKNISLVIESNSTGVHQVKTGKLDWDYSPIYISAEMKASAPIVFAGYGITAPEHNYDDYKTINAAGKIVLVMRHEPGEKDKNSAFEGNKLSKHGTVLTKILNAQSHGAVGIIFVTDPLNHEDTSVYSSKYSQGSDWVSYWKDEMKDNEDYKFMNFRPQMRLDTKDYGVIDIPAVTIDGKLGDFILGRKRSLLDIQKKIDKSMKPNSFALPGKRATMDIFFNTKRIDAYNMVFKVEGSDPKLKNEVVLVGAHYDHVGTNNRGQTYFGADDNASGTAVVMELARVFQSLEKKPKRTVLFVLFTAEEEGLLGSRFYVSDPVVPLEKTIAMVNLDMVGRNDVEQLSIFGNESYPKLFDLVDEVNKKTLKFEFNFNMASSIRSSDQMPFLRHDVPVVYLSSGSNDEYHTPRDRSRLIVADKIERVAQLTFLSVWKMAEQPAGTRFK